MSRFINQISHGPAISELGRLPCMTLMPTWGEKCGDNFITFRPVTTWRANFCQIASICALQDLVYISWLTKGAWRLRRIARPMLVCDLYGQLWPYMGT